MAGEPKSFSHGVDNLLRNLRLYTRTANQAAYPPALTRETAWVKDDEHLLAWFVRCVDEVMGGKPEKWRLENDLAVFAFVEWGEGRRLKYANIQVLRTQCDLEEYYVRARDCLNEHDEPAASRLSQECLYLRLDYDPEVIAPMFGHSVPHVHSQPEGAPRFVLGMAESSNAVMDFVEFVYRQFYHHAWRAWAKRAWIADDSNRGSETAEQEYQRMLTAFKNADVETVRTERALMERMRTAWTRVKYRLFRAESDPVLQRLTTCS